MKKTNNNKIFSLRSVLLILVAIVIGFNVYSWNAEGLVGNKLPMPFGVGVSVVLSGSMEPELSVDDVVFIKKTYDIEIDDVVVFQEGNSLVIHRVIDIDDDTITTKGDANNSADLPIKRSSIKGKMLFKIGGVGKAVQFLKQPTVVSKKQKPICQSLIYPFILFLS